MASGLNAQASPDSGVFLEYYPVSVSHKIHDAAADRQDELHRRRMSYRAGDPETAKLERTAAVQDCPWGCCAGIAGR